MFCFACRKPILRSHKRHVVGCYLVHDDCQNPFMHDLVRAPEQVQELLREKGFEDKITGLTYLTPVAAKKGW